MVSDGALGGRTMESGGGRSGRTMESGGHTCRRKGTHGSIRGAAQENKAPHRSVCPTEGMVAYGERERERERLESFSVIIWLIARSALYLCMHARVHALSRKA